MSTFNIHVHIKDFFSKNLLQIKIECGEKSWYAKFLWMTVICLKTQTGNNPTSENILLFLCRVFIKCDKKNKQQQH